MLVGLFFGLSALIALSGNPLGLIPIFVLLAVAVFLANKREANRAKIQRLAETQITTERQDKAIDEYVALVEKQRKEQEDR